MERKTIEQKLSLSRDNPLQILRDGVTYTYYDEAMKEPQAHTWTEQLQNRGYKTYIDERLVDDIMHGKWHYVFDVYFAEKTEVQPS